MDKSTPRPVLAAHPLPWRIDGDGFERAIYDANGGEVSLFDDDGDGYHALIVEAVNSYDAHKACVEALKRLIDACGDVQMGLEVAKARHEGLAALAQLEEGEKGK